MMSHYHIAIETSNTIHFDFLLFFIFLSRPVLALFLQLSRHLSQKADDITFTPRRGLKLPSIINSREICNERFEAVRTAGPSWVQLGKTCPARACRRHGRSDMWKHELQNRRQINSVSIVRYSIQISTDLSSCILCCRRMPAW